MASCFIRAESGWMLQPFLHLQKSGDALAWAAQGSVGVPIPEGVPECGDVPRGDMVMGMVGWGKVGFEDEVFSKTYPSRSSSTTASSMPPQPVLHFAKKYHVFTGNKHYFFCSCKPVCIPEHESSSCTCLQSHTHTEGFLPFHPALLEANITPGKHHLSAHTADGMAGKSSFLWLPLNDKQQL